MKGITVSKRDPAPKLKTTRELLAANEAKIVTLEAERPTVLVGDSIEAVRDIDRQLGELRNASAAYRDRIAALEEEERRQDHALRVREQQEAIDKIVAPAVAEYVAHGAELQKAFLHFLDLFEGLEAKRSAVHAVWPAAVPRPNSDLWVSHRGDPFNGHHISNIRHSAKKIAEQIAANGASFLAACRQVKIPEPKPQAKAPEPEPQVDRRREDCMSMSDTCDDQHPHPLAAAPRQRPAIF